MEGRSRPLEEPVVGGVADEDVLEAEAELLRAGDRGRPHQLLARHGRQVVRHLGAHRLGRQHGHGRLGERQADDRCRLDHRPLLAPQQVEPRGEQGLDGRRNVEVGEVAGRAPSAHRRSAANRCRSASTASARRRAGCPPRRRRSGPAPRRRCRPRPAARSTTRAASLIGQRLEDDPRRVRVERPVGLRLQQVMARGAQQQDRCALDRARAGARSAPGRSARPSGCRRSRPMTGLLAAQPLQEAARRPERSPPPGTARSTGRWPRPAARSPPRRRCSCGRASPRASSGASSCSMPAASRAASTSGQKVMPSPYGRQRPRSTVASSATEVGELADQARLADAGIGDDGRHAAAPCSSTARRKMRGAGRPAPRSRPTIGASCRRWKPSVASETASSR